MIDTRINALLDHRTSFVVNAKTVAGEAVLKLDRDCDGQVAADEPVLVRRESASADTWKPVKNVGELAQWLETTPPRERSHTLGLWRDKRSFLVFAADGKVQNREVTPMAGEPKAQHQWTLRGGKPRIPYADTVWTAEKFHHMDTQDHPQYKVPEFTAYYYTKIDPSCLKLATVDTPAGPVTAFQEGQVVSRTRVEQVTAFARDGQNWVPMSFKDHDFRGVLD